MNLEPPPSVRKLQTALHAKAKRSPSYRFYLLYDKMYREDLLTFAYQRSKCNAGTVGVDGQSFDDIERYGLTRWLGELAQALRTKTYRPQAVRRAWIPKADGGQRPLGIPTIKDRVVQTAAMLILEPIFEADLQPEQYAYRPARNALDAVKVVRRLLESGRTEVVDADLSGYFDSIPHVELMKSVARRVSDGNMLHLIKMWLNAPVKERDAREKTTRKPSSNDGSGRGTPQGAPLSPLLSNLYMRRFVLCWKQWGLQERLQSYIVNYADDFVICCPRGRGPTAMTSMRQIMSRLKLTVNATKTHLRCLPEERFDFLGYTFGRCYTFKPPRPYFGMYPAQKRIGRFCRSLSDVTHRRWCWKQWDSMVKLLNQKLVGWANYYCLGPVGRAYQQVDRHARSRLRRWLRHKYRLPGRGITRFPDEELTHMGLVSLARQRRIVSWAPA